MLTVECRSECYPPFRGYQHRQQNAITVKIHKSSAKGRELSNEETCV